MNAFLSSACTALALVSTAAFSHGTPGDLAHGDAPTSSSSRQAQSDGDLSTPFGRPGNPKAVSRTVTIRMSDAMRFSPASVNVKRGETIRFLVRNEGKLLHEMGLAVATVQAQPATPETAGAGSLVERARSGRSIAMPQRSRCATGLTSRCPR